MPTLNWIGKDKVVNHHEADVTAQTMPFYGSKQPDGMDRIFNL